VTDLSRAHPESVKAKPIRQKYRIRARPMPQFRLGRSFARPESANDIARPRLAAQEAVGLVALIGLGPCSTWDRMANRRDLARPRSIGHSLAMADPETGATNAPEITVSELSNALKRAIEDRFGFVRVRGEISGYRGPQASGHAYFSLKDVSARLDAVVWRSALLRMKVKPEEGLEVVATGKLTTFPGKSSYQIVIDRLELAGLGALMALLETRRQALAAEGLFDKARKRKVPFMPRVVGVVTSPTGAVIRDILHRLSDRFPVRVVVWPVRVQGETSAEEVAAAIDGFNAIAPGGKIPRPDVLIVARGGGSLEDLWSFNEEIAVRAVARSEIPLIAAVGHETDWTLIDLAADLRAPTPTAAAEFAVPVRAELLASVFELGGRGRGAIRRFAERRRAEFRALARVLPDGEALVEGPRQRLDRAGETLIGRARAAIQVRALKLSVLARGLARHSPHAHVAGLRERVRGLVGRLERAGPQLAAPARRAAEAAGKNLAREAATLMRRRGERAEALVRLQDRMGRCFADGVRHWHARLVSAWQLLGAMSYRGVLARGFALVRDEAERPLRRAADVRQAQRLELEFADGKIAAVAGGRIGPALAPPALLPRRRAKTGNGPDEQGSLF
jgi:exodeoxyribonuclease VII large subunit